MVLVDVTEVGIAVALRVVCMPSVIGDLLGLVVRCGQVIKWAAGWAMDGWRYEAEIYGQGRKDTDERE